MQPLAAVGRALFGQEPEKPKAWLRPRVRQLKHESAVKVVRQLEEMLAGLSAGPTAQTVAREANDFHEHRKRMDYRAALRTTPLPMPRKRRRNRLVRSFSMPESLHV